MKTSLVVALSLSMFTLAGAAHATKTTFTATLSGDHEIPAVTTDATGTAIFTVDDVAKTICGKVTYADLSSSLSAMHIHEGDDTVASGGVIQAIANDASPVNVNIENVTADKLTKILTGETYFNIHSKDHGGGEIRGQLVEGGDPQQCVYEPPPFGDDDDDDDTADSGTGGGKDSGAGTVRADDEPADNTPDTSGKEDDGCSATGSAPANGLMMGLGVGIALTTFARMRRKQRRAN